MTYFAQYDGSEPALCRARIQARTEHFVTFEPGSFEGLLNMDWLREGRRLHSDGTCITESLPEALVWLYAQVVESRIGVETQYRRALADLAKQEADIDAAAKALGTDVPTALALADAVALLPDDELLEVTRPNKWDAALILVSTRERDRVLECLEARGGALAPPAWQALGFGLVIQDSVGKLYIRTARAS